jgi:[ribosomal protein S5]-alanine N-acetyltransferase
VTAHDAGSISALESRHLRLLPHSPAHLLALIESREQFEKQSGLRAADGLREFFVSDEVSPEWLSRLRASTVTDAWVHGFVVVHRESGSAIGSAGFKGPPDEQGIVEIAYGIVPSHEGRGYATEAAGALVAFALESGQVRLLRAHTLPTPNASTRVLAKCGFEYIGEVIDPEDGLVWRWERAVR